jgi:hypothetical protein
MINKLKENWKSVLVASVVAAIIICGLTLCKNEEVIEEVAPAVEEVVE